MTTDLHEVDPFDRRIGDALAARAAAIAAELERREAAGEELCPAAAPEQLGGTVHQLGGGGWHRLKRRSAWAAASGDSGVLGAVLSPGEDYVVEVEETEEGTLVAALGCPPPGAGRVGPLLTGQGEAHIVRLRWRLHPDRDPDPDPNEAYELLVAMAIGGRDASLAEDTAWTRYGLGDAGDAEEVLLAAPELVAASELDPAEVADLLAAPLFASALDAWRALARSPDCPSEVAELIWAAVGTG